MSKLGRTLILQYAASMRWRIGSFDVQTAFLRGREQRDRVLGMEPPPEMQQRFKLNQDQVVRLMKGAYGRVDAPFLWFVELKSALEALSFRQSPFDPCVFQLVCPKSNQTIGLIGIHVDDGLCCGTPEFHQKLKQLEERFPFGSRKEGSFTFTGLKLTQHDDFSISVDQTQYVKDIASISISRERRLQPTDSVTEPERQSLRAVIGSLQYAAINSRPDLCSRVGWLQSQINRATVQTLLDANRTLHEAKVHAGTTIHMKAIPISDLCFVTFSDASFASEKTPDSHQGMIIVAAHRDIGTNKTSIISPIMWHSKKIQR